MSTEEFREYAHQMVDWMADYYKDIESYPVKSRVHPGDIISHLPLSAPEEPESIDAIFADFKKLILPGMAHWQSPGWMAYFPANSSYPSVLAEMLTSTLGAQCMLWETSPAAAELEERMMDWLKQAMGLPEHFTGVIQDTASTATLCALISAREMRSCFTINQHGFDPQNKYRIYCSAEAHSSVDKAVRIAGFGHNNLVKIPVDETLAMIPGKLDDAVREDIYRGFTPLAVIATLGTTGTMAIDPLKTIASITQLHNLWLHVDAAFAGSATILPEWRRIIEGLEYADSYVFNPHKWLFTNFDLSAYYVKERDILIRTFSILPEYLKTKVDQQVKNYRDWGIPLGRRFRALKLWFVLRNFGLEGIREIFRQQIRNIRDLAEKMESDPSLEILAPVNLNMICFRFNPGNIREKDLNDLNDRILRQVNAGGKIFLTHTKINGKYTIRLIAGQTSTKKRHLDQAWELLKQAAKSEMKHD
ncbi:MAG: aspartate aminotransferase family protein [Cyclobacteriaceae bacterium]|nr:aspartate aminotransferase family protein [Cyclobacteriaceae bacterium]